MYLRNIKLAVSFIQNVWFKHTNAEKKLLIHIHNNNNITSMAYFSFSLN